MGLRSLVAVAVMLAAASLAGCECSLVRQVVSIPSPDAETQTLIDSCNARLPAPGESCVPPSEAQPYPPIDCGCLPLCERVLEIIDQFFGRERLQECHVSMSPDAGTSVTVIVTYRPSTCG